MWNLLMSVALVAVLFLPIGVIRAQSTDTVTATCKDGTPFTGTHRSGACRGHGGVQSWGAAPATTGPVNAPSQPTTAPPAPTRSERATPGAGQVWVNTPSKVYHCPGVPVQFRQQQHSEPRGFVMSRFEWMELDDIPRDRGIGSKSDHKSRGEQSNTPAAIPGEHRRLS